MDAEEKLVNDLRAIIISSKGGISMRDLKRDFIDLCGKKEQYESLGFRSLDDFVMARPNEFKFRNNLITAALREESSHIQKLVNQQGGKRRTRPPTKIATPGRRPVPRSSVMPRLLNPRAQITKYMQQPPKYNYNPPPPVQRAPPKPLPLLKAPAANGSRSAAEDDFLHMKKMWSKEILGTLLTNAENERGNQNQVTYSKFKAKATSPREPYRHNNIVEDEEKHDDGVLFKEVAPFQESQPSSAYESASDIASSSTFSSGSSRPSVPSVSPPSKGPKSPPHKPITIEIPVKNIAQSRFARIQAQAQVQEAPQEQLSEVITPSRDVNARLIDLCVKKGLPEPDHKILTHKEGGSNLFSCLIKVGNQVISSDTLTGDPITARNLAVSKAFLLLSRGTADESDSNPKLPSTVEDNALFITRLKQLLECRLSGVWITELPGTYLSAYGIPVPHNYQQLIESNPEFSISVALGRQLLSLSQSAAVNGSSVKTTELANTTDNYSKLSQFVPEDHRADKLTDYFNQPSSYHNGAQISLPSIPALLPVVKEQPQLPPLLPPDDKYWDLYILLAENPREIVARIIGKEYSDAHDEQMAMLEMEMLGGGEVAVNPVVGGHYAVLAGSWSRVRLEKLLPDGRAEVYFIDDGEQEIVQLEQIYVLHNKFFNHPAQALKLSLNGLEAFPEIPQLRNVMTSTLCRKICVCEVLKQFPEDYKNIRACVVLWDTSTAEDVNTNLQLMAHVVAGLRAPVLTTGSTREMVVSQVSESGIHLQSADMSVLCVACLIDYALLNAEVVNVSTVAFDKVYLAKDSRSGSFLRAKVIEMDSKDEFKVQFIDYGTTGDVRLNDLVDAGKLEVALQVCPAQAITVKLSGVEEMSSGKISKARLAVPFGEIVVVKVTSTSENKPCVEMYRRGPNNHALQSINQILRAINAGQDPELQPVNVGLAELKLPEIGDLIFVNVVLSASPHVFTIQIIDKDDQVDILMKGLQKADFESAPITPVSDLRVDEFYAVFYSESWYRARLLGVISSNFVSVELSDFGNLVAPLAIENLRELPSSFRMLPRQAIKASLSGVAPVNADWTPSDCVFFQEYVVGKLLAAYLVSINHSADGPILNLKLIDTSDPDNDVDIASMLVEKKVAIYS